LVLFIKKKNSKKYTPKKKPPQLLKRFTQHPALYRLVSLFRGTALIFGSFYQEKEQEKNNPNEPIPLNPTALIAASFYQEKEQENPKKSKSQYF
jgi:hypothetical protein